MPRMRRRGAKRNQGGEEGGCFVAAIALIAGPSFFVYYIITVI